MTNELISRYIARLPTGNARLPTANARLPTGNARLPTGNAPLPTGKATDAPLLRTDARHVVGSFFGCRLASVFQPVRTVAGLAIGHQAYVRCHGEGAHELSPWNLFARAADDEELVRLDRLCRTVHAINYFAVAPDEWRLFLSVEARLLETVPDEHGRAFERVLRSLGVPTRRVVIVLPEALNVRTGLLGHVIANYRHHGYRVAVRTSGEDDEVLDSLHHLRPDVVKLRHSQDERPGALQRLAARVHDVGARVLVSHLETPRHIEAAVAAGADWLQGHAIAAPSAFEATRTPALLHAVPAFEPETEAIHVPRFEHMAPGDLELPLWAPLW